MDSRLIVTAASRSFGRSLLALLGSLKVNWPDHPRVMVYDIGLDMETRAALDRLGVEVRTVPAFCPHWREYFVWKSWCLLDIPAETYFWLDAGACVLRPIPEVFECAEKLGYFCCTNHWPVEQNTSEAKRVALGVDGANLACMASINGGVFALRKSGKGLWVHQRFHEIALVEEIMIPTNPWHRHDQPILTVLLYQAFGSPLFGDFKTYAGWESPREIVNQAIWVHRTRMLQADQDHFIGALTAERHSRYIPSSLPPVPKESCLLKARIKLAKWRGRYPGDKAGEIISNGVKD